MTYFCKEYWMTSLPANTSRQQSASEFFQSPLGKCEISTTLVLEREESNYTILEDRNSRQQKDL
ncbi:predicted protein [Sclerotinia sclerotiorum 1980 UF-70]|uniref:Uncharacterized protein n=1 Tax=Sclerotinia sclerotiorum (strain ATCC 18683 / 1980 / Ss-1) TaxID=665079 RepID=A7F0U0_SCLS1|nr:predicted protein [Sclerotinia sclerotiorum 1980 UF-70]EDN95332.1 predicted protein [Sclerotinia sclerotiorum 1980 UF-70]